MMICQVKVHLPYLPPRMMHLLLFPKAHWMHLLEDPTGDLADILLYHVVSGKVMSTDLSDGQTATTLLGKDITVTINGDGVFHQ